MVSIERKYCCLADALNRPRRWSATKLTVTVMATGIVGP
jgi:hypothetical protein